MTEPSFDPQNNEIYGTIKTHTLFLRRMSNLSPSPALRSRITKAPVLRAEDHLTSISPATFIAGTFLRCTLLHCKGLNKTKQFRELNRVDDGGDMRFWKISLKIHFMENLFGKFEYFKTWKEFPMWSCRWGVECWRDQATFPGVSRKHRRPGYLSGINNNPHNSCNMYR